MADRSLHKERVDFEGAVNLQGATTLAGTTTVTGKGLTACALSTETTIATATGTTDISIPLPAGAQVLDLGFLVTDQLDVDTSGTVEVSFGTAPGSAADIVTGVQINNTTSSVANGKSMSVLAGNQIMGDAGDNAATPFATFSPAAALYSSAARNLNMRVTIGGATLTATGKMVAFATYVVIN